MQGTHVWNAYVVVSLSTKTYIASLRRIQIQYTTQPKVYPGGSGGNGIDTAAAICHLGLLAESSASTTENPLSKPCTHSAIHVVVIVTIRTYEH